jgi:hypothetical protein
MLKDITSPLNLSSKLLGSRAKEVVQIVLWRIDFILTPSNQ